IAAGIKIRAERRLGELVRDMPKNKGGRPTENQSDDSIGFPTLAEQGISLDESSTWQAMALIPEDELEEDLAEAEAAGQEITTAAVVKKARERKRQARRDQKRSDRAAKARMAPGPTAGRSTRATRSRSCGRWSRGPLGSSSPTRPTTKAWIM